MPEQPPDRPLIEFDTLVPDWILWMFTALMFAGVAGVALLAVVTLW